MTGINYNKWAFHFSIWIMIMYSIQLYVSMNHLYIFAYNTERITQVMRALSVITLLLLLASLICLMLSLVNKQKMNYQFWIAAIVLAFYFLQIAFFLHFTFY
ncbi:hypothetical protein [Kordia sp.]|uniref:hypothetical protein n=1 Tax=Kordia sp. TaxID=1965332 RepID=UPI003B5C0924